MSINLIYTLADARQWAAFSGDYNPIHFDLQYARLMGSEQLSVHGMRAMLDMKGALTNALLPKAEYYRFSARLRQPVHCQTPYRLMMTGSGEMASGNLVSESDNNSCFSAKLAAASQLVLSPTPVSKTLTEMKIAALEHLFPNGVHLSAGCWSFIDALMFHELLVSPTVLESIRALMPALKANTLVDVFTQVSVMQTHHDVHFSARLFEPRQPQALSYAILPTLVIGNPESGLVICCEIQCWNNKAEPLMATSVTLKTSPIDV
jgi:hypothetical protein